MENFKEIKFITEENETEVYLQFKADIIESIEVFKTQKANTKRYYEDVIKPQILALNALKEKYADDEKLVNYADERLSEIDSKGFSEEKLEGKIENLEKLQANYERVLEEYFTEEIVDGKAQPKQKALNYCEIAKILAM